MKGAKRNLLFLLLLVVFFLVLFKLIYGPGTASKMDNLFRFHNCLDLLESGKLYSQYACWHGPTLYHTYYAFKLIFGSYFALWSTIILSALILLMILHITWKETNTKKFIIPVILYTALILPLIMDFFSLAAELVASVYMLAGIILLMYWKSKTKLFFVSLLFTLSFLSSQAVLSTIAIFLIIYVLEIIKKDSLKKFIRVVKSQLNQALFILIPILGLNALFIFLYSDFLRFVYLGFVAAKTNSFFSAVIQTIIAFLTPNLVKLPLTIILIVGLYSLFKNRNKYLTASFFSLLITSILLVRTYPVYDAFDVYFLYNNKFIPSIILFIIGFSILISKINLTLKKYEQV